MFSMLYFFVFTLLHFCFLLHSFGWLFSKKKFHTKNSVCYQSQRFIQQLYMRINLHSSDVLTQINYSKLRSYLYLVNSHNFRMNETHAFAIELSVVVAYAWLISIVFFRLFKISGDRLVAQGGQNQTYPSPHNVQIQLTYPSQGYGAAVTYVAIVVNQVRK